MNHLAKESDEDYVSVARKAGLKLDGKIDAVGLAAMKQDAQLKDLQKIKMLKHLRHTFGNSDVTVPYLQVKQFSDGYVKPRTKNSSTYTKMVHLPGLIVTIQVSMTSTYLS